MKQQKTIRVIDITPTWVNLLPILFDFLQSGNQAQQALAKEEITKMAKAADLYIKSTKK